MMSSRDKESGPPQSLSTTSVHRSTEKNLFDSTALRTNSPPPQRRDQQGGSKLGLPSHPIASTGCGAGEDGGHLWLLRIKVHCRPRVQFPEQTSDPQPNQVFADCLHMLAGGRLRRIKWASCAVNRVLDARACREPRLHRAWRRLVSDGPRLSPPRREQVRRVTEGCRYRRGV